jgi:Ca-activated chloride channel family protein
VINNWFRHIDFAYPLVLSLLLIVPILAGWYISRFKPQSASMRVSSLSRFQNTTSWKRTLRHVLPLLRLVSITSLILALARPQTHHDERNVEGDGIDIILCLDVSGSMLAQDFKPNRMEAAREVAADFVGNRPTDRFGLVIFAGESFTLCPLTSDHNVVRSQIQNMRGGFLVDGTAIGSGLATSVDRLKSSKARSRIVILLTDGENNGGLIDPKTAKEIARSLNVKVYTIGIGTEGYAPTPVATPGGGIIMQQEKVNIDEKLLGEIARETGGKYYRARGNDALIEIYREIDKLEKTKVEISSTRNFTDKFQVFAWIAIACMFMEVMFRYTIFRKFP